MVRVEGVGAPVAGVRVLQLVLGFEGDAVIVERREVIGLEVGSTLCAEGMVGEDSGALTILNPSYEIVI